jgi:large subunit ribosomal protein L10
LAELRARLREAEAQLTVVKNTLTRRAAAESGREALIPYLDGPSGLVWCGDDPARAAKALADYARGRTGRLAIKGGLLSGRPVDTAAVHRLAALPPREQLLAQLAGGIAAPLSGLAGGLGNLIGGLARTLAAVRDQRAAAEGAPAS